MKQLVFNISLVGSFCIFCLHGCQSNAGQPESKAIVDSVRIKDESQIKDQVSHFTGDRDAYDLNNSIVDSIYCLWSTVDPYKAMWRIRPIMDYVYDSITITSYTSNTATAEFKRKRMEFPTHQIFFLHKKEGHWIIDRVADKAFVRLVKEVQNKKSVVLYTDTPKLAGVIIQFGIKKPRFDDNFVHVCGDDYSFLKGEFFIKLADKNGKKSDTLFVMAPKEISDQRDSTYPGIIDQEIFGKLKIDTNFMLTEFFPPFDSSSVVQNKVIYRLAYDYNWADYCVKYYSEIVYDTKTNRLYQQRQKDGKLWRKKAPSEDWLRQHLP
jgi:hypothetical protein